MKINGTSVLVTGCNGAFGTEISKRLKSSGLNVVGLSRNRQCSNEFVDQYIQISNWDRDSEILEVSEQLQEFGKFDNVIFCHGAGEHISFRFADFTQINETAHVHFLGVAKLTARLLRNRLVRSPGRFVAIGSISAHMGSVALPIYGASKAALESLFRSLAREYLKKQITFNTIAAGPVKTKLWEGAGESALKVFDSRANQLGPGSPEDIANTVEFVLDEESRFMTGTTLIVDGGSYYMV